jgi:hypothetical protein
MARVTFDMHTGLRPERALAMLTDFSARRPELWPTLTRELYAVYEVHPTGADVKEGSPWPTRMWERVHYDWTVLRRVAGSARAKLWATASPDLIEDILCPKRCTPGQFLVLSPPSAQTF